MTDSLLDMENLLDTATDAVENRPDYVNPEPGIYNEIYRGFKEAEKVAQKDTDTRKKGDKYKVIILNYEILETVEGGNPNAPIKPGSLSSEQFTLSAEGLPAIKQRYAQILGVEQEELTGSMREIMTVAKDMMVKSQYTKSGDFTRKKVLESLGSAAEA